MRQFICIINIGEYKDIFTLLSDDIAKVAYIIKNVYVFNHLDEDELDEFNKMSYVEKMHNGFIKVYDTQSINTDTDKMDDILDKIQIKQFSVNIPNMVKQLVVSLSYKIIYHDDKTIIQRYEEIYTGGTNQWSMRRELSDYDKKENLFKLNDKVRIKGYDKIYSVFEAPVQEFNDIWWTNKYTIYSYEDDLEIEVHESELEKA